MSDAAVHGDATAAAGIEPAAARGRRAQRAELAAALIARAPLAAARLDWDALDAAPAWLGWADPRLLQFQAQVGALLCAPELRLWIDAPRLAAAARVVDARFLRALLALPDTQVLPRDVARSPQMTRAEQVAPQLRAAGAGVLLAALSDAVLRQVAAARLMPGPASPMAAPLAQSLVERAQWLADKESTT